jgi:hypothetical protein
MRESMSEQGLSTDQSSAKPLKRVAKLKKVISKKETV